MLVLGKSRLLLPLLILLPHHLQGRPDHLQGKGTCQGNFNWKCGDVCASAFKGRFPLRKTEKSLKNSNCADSPHWRPLGPFGPTRPSEPVQTLRVKIQIMIFDILECYPFQKYSTRWVWHDFAMIWRPQIGNVEVMTYVQTEFPLIDSTPPVGNIDNMDLIDIMDLIDR